MIRDKFTSAPTKHLTTPLPTTAAGPQRLTPTRTRRHPYSTSTKKGRGPVDGPPHQPIWPIIGPPNVAPEGGPGPAKAKARVWTLVLARPHGVETTFQKSAQIIVPGVGWLCPPQSNGIATQGGAGGGRANTPSPLKPRPPLLRKPRVGSKLTTPEHAVRCEGVKCEGGRDTRHDMFVRECGRSVTAIPEGTTYGIPRGGTAALLEGNTESEYCMYVCMYVTYVKIRRHQHTRVHAHTGPRRPARAPACRWLLSWTRPARRGGWVRWVN